MILSKENEFIENIKKCEKLFINNNFENKLLKIEIFVESMKDWATVLNYKEVKDWYLSRKKNAPMKVEEIAVLDCKNWYLDQNDGFVKHKSGFQNTNLDFKTQIQVYTHTRLGIWSAPS